MSKASVQAAVQAVAPKVARQFDRPNNKQTAECLVFYDALAISGYATELEELRAMKDPIGFVQSTLKGK